MVGSCSVLELFILISMYRIKRRGQDSANFEMVHDEYCKLLDQGGSGDRRSKAAALRAFERLIAASLVSYVDSRCVHFQHAAATVMWLPHCLLFSTLHALPLQNYQDMDTTNMLCIACSMPVKVHVPCVCTQLLDADVYGPVQEAQQMNLMLRCTKYGPQTQSPGHVCCKCHVTAHGLLMPCH